MDKKANIKEIKVYKKTTDFTAGPSALLTILNVMDKTELTKENEFRIWNKTAVLPTKGASIYALALVAKSHGLNVKVIVGQKSYKFPNYRFKSYKAKEIEIAEYNSTLYLNDAIKKGIDVEERQISFDDVINALKNNSKIILRLNSAVFSGGRAEAVYYALLGLEGKKILFADTTTGVIKLYYSKIKEAFETVNEKCKRDNRMLIISN